MKKLKRYNTLSRTFNSIDNYKKNVASESAGVRANIRDMNRIKTEVVDAIINKRAGNLNKLLSEEYIYPNKVTIETFESPLYISRKEYYSPTEYYEYFEPAKPPFYRIKHETYFVRPTIEAMFFDHNELFQEIVSEIVESDSSDIHTCFQDLLNKSDIPAGLLEPLDVDKVRTNIAEISAYGETLKADPDKKRSKRGEQLIQLADELKMMLNSIPSMDESAHSRMKLLDFKLKFLKLAHSKDADFADHHGYKRLITNLATLIFSAGILNVINLVVTRQFLFFNRTATQTLLNNVDDMVCPIPSAAKIR